MKHIFIINPTAGKQDSRQRIYDMAKELREKHELDVQCILTKKQGHATEIARKLCKGGGELRFYACGGDGTANEVANGILGFDNAAMTMVPVGTGNDLLKNFGDDLEKFRDVENLWDGPIFPMDVIEVNGRYALTIACSGIDARVAADVHKYSESPLLDGKSSYIVSLLVNFFFKGIGSHWKVEMDGEEMEGDWSLVSVCNGRYYGGGFMPVAEARMDDGVLNTLVVQKVTRRAFIRFVGRTPRVSTISSRTSRSATRRRSCTSPPKSPTSSPVSTANAFRAARSPSVWPTRSSTSSAPQAAAATRQRGEGEFDHFVNFWFFSEIPLAKSE